MLKTLLKRVIGSWLLRERTTFPQNTCRCLRQMLGFIFSRMEVSRAVTITASPSSLVKHGAEVEQSTGLPLCKPNLSYAKSGQTWVYPSLHPPSSKTHSTASAIAWVPQPTTSSITRAISSYWRALADWATTSKPSLRIREATAITAAIARSGVGPPRSKAQSSPSSRTPNEQAHSS